MGEWDWSKFPIMVVNGENHSIWLALVVDNYQSLDFVGLSFCCSCSTWCFLASVHYSEDNPIVRLKFILLILIVSLSFLSLTLEYDLYESNVL